MSLMTNQNFNLPTMDIQLYNAVRLINSVPNAYNENQKNL